MNYPWFIIVENFISNRSQWRSVRGAKFKKRPFGGGFLIFPGLGRRMGIYNRREK